MEETLNMSKWHEPQQPTQQSTWLEDQLAKSLFFHIKLHEWMLLETAEQLEQLRGDQLDWDHLEQLGISRRAWNKVIHSGVKPVMVFAHPEVLRQYPRLTGYYRMLAMVSQKSMSRLRLPVNAFEDGSRTPTQDEAQRIAYHLNSIISRLVEGDEVIRLREMDIWRGMAAGAQAQGSWQNAKGKEAEILVKELVRQQAHRVGIKHENDTSISLVNGLEVRFSDDPDVSVERQGQVTAVIEIKGGIDPAGALERLGAAIKTLQRVKQKFEGCITILLIRRSSTTEGVKSDIERSRAYIDVWFTIEDFLNKPEIQEEIWRRLGLL
jgi:hypothetical protein